MKRPPPAFNKNESAILIEIYEEPNVPYTLYSLTQKLNQTIKFGTPDYLAAFTNTRDAVEDLIVRGLVRGKRLKGADGIYFDDLKLTTKGEQSAIQERRRVAEFEKALPDLIKDHNAVVEEMRKSEKEK